MQDPMWMHSAPANHLGPASAITNRKTAESTAHNEEQDLAKKEQIPLYGWSLVLKAGDKGNLFHHLKTKCLNMKKAKECVCCMCQVNHHITMGRKSCLGTPGITARRQS